MSDGYVSFSHIDEGEEILRRKHPERQRNELFCHFQKGSPPKRHRHVSGPAPKQVRAGWRPLLAPRCPPALGAYPREGAHINGGKYMDCHNSFPRSVQRAVIPVNLVYFRTFLSVVSQNFHEGGLRLNSRQGIFYGCIA